jgi:16S rRNA (cytosine1402-N4)-methyltransferase
VSEFSPFHQPVLVAECVAFLQPRVGGVYLDCTLGGGGHAQAILKAAQGQVTLVGLDMDPEAIQSARETLIANGGQVKLVEDNFARVREALSRIAVDRVDGLLADLGVSSHQLDDKGRGFSFQAGSPLDMRMNPASTLTASQILNEWPRDDLEALLQRGEVPGSARIATSSVDVRQRRKFVNSEDLLRVFQELHLPRRRSFHPGTLVFQALRLAVNRELENLSVLLSQLPLLLQPSGRAVFISYHSLEDRLIKQAFKELGRTGVCKILTGKVVRPTREEILQNPRSRSAKLRAIERTVL